MPFVKTTPQQNLADDDAQPPRQPGCTNDDNRHHKQCSQHEKNWTIIN
jgi:hypothetical protein